MDKIERNDIHIISRHSNWSHKSVEKLLEKELYADKAAWQKFLRLFFISLGVSFTTAGIIFFFAYNWADLHKFAKIGVIEALVIAVSAFILFSKLKPDIKNIFLTGAAILVGILFTVFGQVYQTGANAYDLFLIWTIAIVLWVAISNFAPLWLVFVILVNTTYILYYLQVLHHDYNFIEMFMVLFLINLAFVTATICIKHFLKTIQPSTWYINTVSLAAIIASTIGVCIGIFESSDIFFYPLVVVTIIAYASGIVYALKTKSTFYLSIIPLSVIIILSTFFIEISTNEYMFFMISFFIVISVTLVIINLVNLQKKWKN